MVNYKNGKIYKIVNDIDNEVYVGSTTQALSHRLDVHRNHSKIQPNRKIYAHLNKIGWNNVHIFLIECYPCDNREQLNKKEREWKEKIGAGLNTNRAIRSVEEKKEQIKNCVKIFYENNPEKRAEYNKKYYYSHKEQILERNKKMRSKSV